MSYTYRIYKIYRTRAPIPRYFHLPIVQIIVSQGLISCRVSLFGTLLGCGGSFRKGIDKGHLVIEHVPLKDIIGLQDLPSYLLPS